MFKFRTIAIVPLLLCACLPPPQAWPVAEGEEGAVGQDTGPAVVDDTANPSLACSSIVFGETGHLVMQASDLDSGYFFTNGDFTVEFWAWFSDVDLEASRTLVSMGTNSSWWIGVENHELVFRTEDSDIRHSAPTEGWHHVAVVNDEAIDEIRMYMDESLAGVLPFNGIFPNSENDELHVARSGGASLAWQSAMDEVRFANQVHYAGASVSILDPLDTEPWAGVWHFNDGLSNAITGFKASGSDYEIRGSCP